MPEYYYKLKKPARVLRSNMTDAEQVLWQHLRRKQVLGVQFYRQRPIDIFIVDFYAHQPRLVIEVDGGHHLRKNIKQRDNERTQRLEQLGLHVIRFTNLEVLENLEGVMERIYSVVAERLKSP
jgi:very-short-patch-repair endonuclease